MQYLGIVSSVGIVVVAYILLSTSCPSLTSEKTLVIIKPDGTSRNLTSTIYGMIESSLRLSRSRSKHVPEADRNTLVNHYEEHKGKPFFESLIKYMMSGTVDVSEWEGPPGSIEKLRELVGATDPKKASKHTIRGIYAESRTRNTIHASDSIESAEREIRIWFS